jgi:predicted GNAT family acetyltransferase
MPREIVHDEAARTYRLLDEDGAVLSHTDYRLAAPAGADATAGRAEAVMVFHHTYTVPAQRGNGYAEEVVRAALDDVRRRSAQAAATCWFVDDFIRSHPEYADLVA